MHRTPHAFTLIELLVVISIIALLVGILLPVLGAVRSRAFDIQCQARIRSMGQGYLAYLTDYDGRFAPYQDLLPGFWNSPLTGSRRNPVALIDQSPLLDYLSADRRDVLVCPVFRRSVQDLIASSIPSNGVSFSYVLSAGVDPNSEASGYKPFDQTPLNLADVRSTTSVGMFVEENPWPHPGFARDAMNDGRFVVHRWPNQDTLATYHYPGTANYDYTPSPSDPGTRDLNTGKSHAAFVDGHVEIVLTTESEWVVYDDVRWANRPEFWR